MYMLRGFTGDGDFWQFSASSEVCALFIPAYLYVDGFFLSKENIQSSKRRGKKAHTKKKEWKSVIEEARVTPSHPVDSLLVGLSPCPIWFSCSFIVPPLVSRVWFSDCEI